MCQHLPTYAKCCKRMEKKHVHDVYDCIATHFDETRHTYWKMVASFLDNVAKHSVVLDIGCGNGKYQHYRNDICWFANDTCLPLLHIAKEKAPHDYVAANGLCLPYLPCMFDAAISIAVLHHVSTSPKRAMFLKEVMRCVRQGGVALVSVWADDHNQDARKSKWRPVPGGDPGDYMIPWRDKHSGSVHDRYYHLFTIEDVFRMLHDAGIHHSQCDIRYEQDNWYIYIIKY